MKVDLDVNVFKEKPKNKNHNIIHTVRLYNGDAGCYTNIINVKVRLFVWMDVCSSIALKLLNRF